MLSSSSVSKQTEGVLEDVLRTIREEYEGPHCAVRNRPEEVCGGGQSSKATERGERVGIKNCSSWRCLLGLPSLPMSKCLKDAQELLQRVKTRDSSDYLGRYCINSKMRTRLSGKSNLPPPSIHGQGSARAPEQDGGRPLTEGNSEPDSALTPSPRNMHSSLSEPGASEVDVDVNPPVQNATGSSREANEWHVIKENCLEISGSNVDGVTMNNDSNNCSGADGGASTLSSYFTVTILVVYQPDLKLAVNCSLEPKASVSSSSTSKTLWGLAVVLLSNGWGLEGDLYGVKN
ncbi:hypothetical protein L210DRAFT_3629166, partial [Boletus edulis BED1]